jgi:hypothetical protein
MPPPPTEEFAMLILLKVSAVEVLMTIALPVLPAILTLDTVRPLEFKNSIPV